MCQQCLTFIIVQSYELNIAVATAGLNEFSRIKAVSKFKHPLIFGVTKKFSNGMDTVGMDTVGMDTVGMDTVGMDTVGMDTIGMDTVGIHTNYIP